MINATTGRALTTDFKSPSQMTSLLGQLSLLYLAPALGTVLLAHAFGKADLDDDDDRLDILLELGGEALGSALNTMVNAAAGVIFRSPAPQAQPVDSATALLEGKTRNPGALLVGPPREAR